MLEGRFEIGRYICLSLGDFSDDPFDESLMNYAQATREWGDVERSQTADCFYNLAWRYLGQQGRDRNGRPKVLNGSLYFNGNGNVFDQILVSMGLVRRLPFQADMSAVRRTASAILIAL